MKTNSIPLDVLTEAVEALRIAKGLSLNAEDTEIVVNAWCRLSWRVEEMLQAQRIEVTE